MNWRNYMTLFKKKNLTRTINLHQVLDHEGYMFIIDDLVIEKGEVKLNLFMDGNYTLLYEDDMDELYSPLIEYVGFKNADLYINGKKLLKKKVYQRSNQSKTSAYLKELYEKDVISFENLGRQTLVYIWEQPEKNIESIQLIHENKGTLVKVKRTMSQLSVDQELDLSIPYRIKEDREVILRKLAVRPIKLHPQVQDQMEKRRMNEDLEVLEDIGKYHNLIGYFEVPSDVSELMMAIRTNFENASGGYGGLHKYESLPLIKHNTKMVIKEFGLIPKGLMEIDLRIGYINHYVGKMVIDLIGKKKS